MANRHINDKGLLLIQSFERLILKPYNDGYGYMTIYWGHLIKEGEVFNGTREEADETLRRDLLKAERAVIKQIKVPLSEGQFSALVSFTFNAGSGNLQRSTLRQKLNRGEYNCSPLFMRYIKSSGKVSKGLIRRRKAEVELFNS